MDCQTTKKSLTAAQQAFLDCIKEFIRKNNISPTISELAKELGFKSNTAAVNHLSSLIKKQRIKREPGTRRGIKLLNDDLTVQSSFNVDTLVKINTSVTPLQKIVFNNLVSYFEVYGIAPTINELKKQCKINSVSSIANSLASLERKQLIERDCGRARGLKIKGVYVEFDSEYRKLQPDPNERVFAA